MKILCFKFKQNYTINEEFDFFEEVGDLRGDKGFPIQIIVISIIIGKHIEMLCFKIAQ